jgi:hypothetical protein
VVVVRWAGPPLPDGRLVVIAPHPDDEVLAAGGLMRWTAHHRRDVVVVAVTDGEASHARSRRVTPEALRARRARERCEAFARLGVPEVAVHRLGEPDQGCAARVADIAAAIRAIVEPSDVVVAPSWARVHGTAGPPTTTLELDEVSWLAKQHAVTAYRSQLEALGPDPEDGPVVHPHELDLMLTRHEQFLGTPV